MKLTNPLAGLFAALAFIGISSTATAQFTTIATESFDYPLGPMGGASGGTGWAGAWFSGLAMDHAVVTAPSIDAIGNKCTTNFEFAGNWRHVEPTNFPSLATFDVNGVPAFGADDTTIWVSHSQQRVAGGDHGYGGLSLWIQAIGEALFIGSPGGTDEVGIDAAFCCGGPLLTVPGTSADNLHRIVVKVEFKAGDDDISLWLDPPVPHPDPLVNPPDLTATVPNFVFNEIRLESGTGAIPGFDFDDIVFETDSGQIGTSYCIATVNSTGSASSITATGSASISANNLVLRADSLPNQPGIFIAGPAQAQVPFFNGFLCVDPGGLQRFVNASSPTGGVITEAVDYPTAAPGGLNVTAGASYYYQRWNRDPAAGGGNANFSDGIEIVHAP